MIIRILKFFSPSISTDFDNWIRYLAKHSLTRSWINLLYRAMPYSQKGRWHARFSKLFCAEIDFMEASDWKVNFVGSKIIIPITGDQGCVEWDAAMSILGHDIEILRTYETIISFSKRPIVFFDVGSNYGLHSLLFLVKGIRTVSFEPNPICRDFFNKVCEKNKVSADVQQVALGDQHACKELCFPERMPWLGTVDSLTKATLKKHENLNTIQVPMITLDSFVEKVRLYPNLIKIDTEGNELMVLQGSVKTISECQPMIIFESFPGVARPLLWSFFETQQYNVFALPLRSLKNKNFLNESKYLASLESNFIALPTKMAAQV